MRNFLAFVVGLAITTFAVSAGAYGGGASGYTGKQGLSCNGCHSGGTAPQVTITGPDTLAAGATGDFTMVVTTGQTKAAGGIAATDGTTLAPGTNLIETDGELTHSNGGVNVSGGKATFSFKVTAPATGTTLRIFAVGLAANGSGTGGDKATQITKDLTITGGGMASTPPAPAGSTPTPTTPPSEQADNKASPTSTTTDPTEPTSSKKTTKDTSTTGDDDDDDDSTSNTRHRRDPFAGDATTACTMHSGKPDPSGLSAVAGLVLGLALIARRRRA